MQYFRQVHDKLKKDAYLKTSLVLFIFSMISSITNYIFQVVCNRNLSPSDYGQLNSILALITIILAISPIIKQWLVKVFSEIYVHKKYTMIHNILKMYYKNFFSAYVIFLLFLLVFHGHIVGFLKLTNNTHLWFMAAFFALNLILIPLMSLLEGLNRFGHRYFATFLGDLSLITSTCVFLYFHFSIEKAFLAKLSPMVVGIIAMVFFYRRDKVINGSDDVSKPLNEQGKLESKNLLSFLQIGLGPICMTIILNIDMMIARVTLSSTDSGTYATISILGKALFFFATVNLPLFYVKCNEAFFKKANILIIILKGFGYTTILSISGLVGLWIIIDLFILLLNPIYVNDTGLVLYYALSMIPYAFVQMMITLFMSFNTYKAFFVLLIMTMIQVIILFLSPHDILTIVNIRLYSGLVFCVVLVYFIVKIIFHQKSESKV